LPGHQGTAGGSASIQQDSEGGRQGHTSFTPGSGSGSRRRVASPDHQGTAGGTASVQQNGEASGRQAHASFTPGSSSAPRRGVPSSSHQGSPGGGTPVQQDGEAGGRKGQQRHATFGHSDAEGRDGRLQTRSPAPPPRAPAPFRRKKHIAPDNTRLRVEQAAQDFQTQRTQAGKQLRVEIDALAEHRHGAFVLGHSQLSPQSIVRPGSTAQFVSHRVAKERQARLDWFAKLR